MVRENSFVVYTLALSLTLHSDGSPLSFFLALLPVILSRFPSPLPFPSANGKRRGRRKGEKASEPRKLEIVAKLHRHVACRVTEIIFAVLSPCREGMEGGKEEGSRKAGKSIMASGRKISRREMRE
jgi:hypothetical protein